MALSEIISSVFLNAFTVIMIFAAAVSGILSYMTGQKTGGNIGVRLRIVALGMAFVTLLTIVLDTILLPGVPPLFMVNPTGTGAMGWIRHLLEAVGYTMILVGFWEMKDYMEEVM
ncbi:MAG: hypothetical protein SVV03_02930 [Candidatus Nanohaloarchaea archaeon]|nr:hypothetical protein [Candidatus Nanohaloarchaea archaeon]